MNLIQREIVSCDLAIKIGKVLCEALYNDLIEQEPLSARDEGTFWRIEGNRNRSGSVHGKAEFFLSIEKKAGRILDVGEFVRSPLPSSVSELIEERSSPSLHPSTQPIFKDETNKQSKTAGSSTGMLLIIQMARGGIIFSSDLAVKIGELFCEAHCGDLSRQKPLAATDEKEYWRVEGMGNKDKKNGGIETFSILVQKYDGRVSEISE